MKDRIMHLLGILGLSPSQFAESLGIQRSSMSHIMSGRNRPSLDLVTRILEKYPDIDPDWLLLGKNDVYRSKPNNLPEIEHIAEKRNEPAAGKEEREEMVRTAYGKNEGSQRSTMERIVIFYTDGTFKDYLPGE